MKTNKIVDSSQPRASSYTPCVCVCVCVCERERELPSINISVALPVNDWTALKNAMV